MGDWEQETCDDGRRLGLEEETARHRLEEEMVRHQLEHQLEDRVRESAVAQVEE